MRLAVAVLLLLALPAAAGDFERLLRKARSGDRVTRREALESLADGTVQPGNPSQAAKMARTLDAFLTSKSLGTDRALAVLALGRLRSPKVYAALVKRMRKERDDRVLAAMDKVFSEAPPEWHDTILARFGKTASEDAIQRAVYMRMASALPGKKVRAYVRTRARMADPWVIQATVVQALLRDKDERVPELCIELLDAGDRAVNGAALEVLEARTGKRFGRDVVAWKTWWNTRKKTDSLDRAIAEAEKQGGPRPETKTVSREEKKEPVRSYFFGMPIRGRKVVFVFDISASMRKKLPIALEQLVKSIKGLPPRTKFEVVFFNEFVWPWRNRLSHADPVTKALLIEHLRKLEIKSYTNLFDAMEKGLLLDPDEMFVISDGAPNRGRKKFERDILSELKRLNERSKAVIHTVSVVRTVDGDDHIGLLKRIAAENGGESVQRTLY
ncbi:MAG: hypothetical protein ACYTGZ_10860 [Planctomycetota bacterium]|jgi:hypothetical protein